jgi:hypothetical protein
MAHLGNYTEPSFIKDWIQEYGRERKKRPWGARRFMC